MGYQNITNIDYDKVFLRNMKIRCKTFFTKVKICDVVTILVILTLTYPFISFNIHFFFFVFIFELVYIFFLILANFSIVKEILFFNSGLFIKISFRSVYTIFNIFISRDFFGFTNFVFLYSKYKLALLYSKV